MTKQSERVQKSAEDKLLAISKQDSEFVANLLGAWNAKKKQFNKNIALDLITKPETIKNLSQVTDDHNVRCFYAMHAISIALDGVNCSDILNKMSDADIKILQKSIQAAKQRLRPDTEALEKGLANSRARKYEQSSRLGIERAANQKSMALYGIVAERWDNAVAELNRWGDAVDNFERVVPIAKQWVTYEELYVALGFENIGQFYKTKYKLSKTHSEIEKWFECHGSDGKLFNMAHFEELKKLIDEMHVVKTSKDVWTIVQLADKMGLNGENDQQKCKKVTVIKYAIKKKFPEVEKYFTPTRRGFYAEYFEDFQNLRALVFAKKPKAEKRTKTKRFDPNKAVKISDLAPKMGLATKALRFRMDVFLKKATPERMEEVKNWFISTQKPGDKSAVKIEFVDQFIALFGGERKRGRPANKSNKRAKKTAKTVKLVVVDKPNAKPAESTDKAKKYVLPISTPKNVQELRTFDQILKSLLDQLKQAQAEQNQAEQKYDAILYRVQKPGYGIDDALQELSPANAEIKAAAARVKEIQVQILNACKEQEKQDRNAFDAATKAKRAADQNAADAEDAWEYTKALIGRFAQEFGINEK